MIDKPLEIDLRVHAGPYEQYRIIRYDDQADRWWGWYDSRTHGRALQMFTSRELAELLHKAWRFEEERNSK